MILLHVIFLWHVDSRDQHHVHIPIPEVSQQGAQSTRPQSKALGGEKEEKGSQKDQEYAKENTNLDQEETEKMSARAPACRLTLD